MTNTLNGIAYVKFLKGTPSAFNKLSVKDQDTLYFISEPGAVTGCLYLGDKLIDATANTSWFKTKTNSEWENENPVLGLGEPGFASDVFRLKVGNGALTWKELPWLTGDGNGAREVISANSTLDFPTTGDKDLIYKSYADKTLYQWNEEEKKYEPLNSSTVTLEGVKYIYGGNANG